MTNSYTFIGSWGFQDSREQWWSYDGLLPVTVTFRAENYKKALEKVLFIKQDLLREHPTTEKGSKLRLTFRLTKIKEIQ